MKQIFALILSVTLMFSLFVSSAFAVDETDMMAFVDEVNIGMVDTAFDEESDFADSAAVPVSEEDYSASSVSLENGQLESDSGKLENAGDYGRYEFTVDHSVTPEIGVFVRISGEEPGRLVAMLSDSIGSSYAAKGIFGIPTSATDMINTPKNFWVVSNQTGETVTYKVTVLAETDDVSYTISYGTLDKLNEALGGQKNMVPVAKNVASSMSVGYIHSYVALLNGDGDWFRYKATTSETYVALRSNNYSSLAFEIYDAETGLRIDRSNSSDVFTKQYSSTFYEYTAQRRYDLDPGHEYYIKMYSTKPCVPSDPTETYDVAIGFPAISTLMVSYSSPSTYSLKANVSTTFRINVSGLSQLARPYEGFGVAFNTASSANNSLIKVCTITAPNGMSFSLSPSGKGYLNDIPNDFENFLTNSKNIPLNGTWIVTARSSGSLSGLRLKFSGGTYRISCNEPQ